MSKISPIPMHIRAPDMVVPTGWYCVAESSQISSSEMYSTTWLEQPIIVYRTADGRAQIADAFCPHVGAHLASQNGSLCDGIITCPFHKWSFDSSNGNIMNIPYSKIIPKSVKLKLFHTREIDRMIMLWHGISDPNPSFEPFDSTEIRRDGEWSLYGVREWESSAVFRDILENIFDTAHVVQLHNAETFPKIENIEYTKYGMKISYENEVIENASDGVLKMTMYISGLSLLAQVFSSERCTVSVISSFTPLNNERVREVVRFYLKVPKDSDNLDEKMAIGKEFTDRFIYEEGRDVEILNYKKHIVNPNLCSGDGPIMKYRKYSQRYYI